MWLEPNKLLSCVLDLPRWSRTWTVGPSTKERGRHQTRRITWHIIIIHLATRIRTTKRRQPITGIDSKSLSKRQPMPWLGSNHHQDVNQLRGFAQNHPQSISQSRCLTHWLYVSSQIIMITKLYILLSFKFFIIRVPWIIRKEGGKSRGCTDKFSECRTCNWNDVKKIGRTIEVLWITFK